MSADLEALRARISGPVFSVLTPFREDESIDYPTLARSLERIHAAGGRIFYAMAYNSRYSQLDDAEILDLNAFVVETVKGLDPGHIVIVGDPIHCSTRRSAQFARHAHGVGADLISLICREKLFYEDQIVAHYQRIADASPIGILLHEMPFLSGLNGKPVNWPLTLLDRLADIPSVIAIKEDAKDDAYTKEAVAAVRDRLAIVISGGGKRQWLRFKDHGVGAWLNGIGVFEPRLAVRFHRAVQEGDEATVRWILDEIEVPFFERCVSRFGWHLAIKAALEARGVMPRWERMPLAALPAAQAAEVAAVIGELPIDAVLEAGEA